MVRVRAGFFSAGMVSLISRKILLLVCFSFAQPQLLCFLLRLKRTSDLVLDLNIIINLSITRLGFFRLVISSNLSFVFLFAFVLLFCVQLFCTIFTHFLSSQVVFESVCFVTVNGKESLDYYNHSPFEQNNKKNPVGVKETGIQEKKRGGGWFPTVSPNITQFTCIQLNLYISLYYNSYSSVTTPKYFVFIIYLYS